MEAPAFVNYIDALPKNQFYGDYSHESLPVEYPFAQLNKFNRPQLVNLLSQYVNGLLPAQLFVQPLFIFNSAPYGYLAKYRVGAEIRPVYLLSHQCSRSHILRDQFDTIVFSDRDQFKLWYPSTLKPVNSNGQVVGTWQKYTYKEARASDRNWKLQTTNIKMDVYSLPDNAYPLYHGVEEDISNKRGNWKLCKIYRAKPRRR